MMEDLLPQVIAKLIDEAKEKGIPFPFHIDLLASNGTAHKYLFAEGRIPEASGDLTKPIEFPLEVVVSRRGKGDLQSGDEILRATVTAGVDSQGKPSLATKCEKELFVHGSAQA
jgi:hypothetical protein